MATDSYPYSTLQPNTPLFTGLTRGRLNQAEGGRYGDRNFTSALYLNRTDSDKHVQMTYWSAPGLSKPSFEEALKQDNWKPLSKGHKFGPSWSNHWVKVVLNVPKEMADSETVQFEFDPGCEAMIFNENGLSLQGITGGFGGDRRVEHVLTKEAKTHKCVRYIEVSCNGMFGIGNSQDWGDPDPNRYFTLLSADIVEMNMPAWHLLWDFRALRDVVDTLPENSPLRNQALVAANEMFNVFDYKDPSSIQKTRQVAERILGKDWASLGHKVYDTEGRAPSIAISNCHIDTAWMWPFSVTQQKVARSWSTQCDLIDRYPEHTFTCSTAQQVKWLEQLYPKLFEVVKEKVKGGRFHMVGGSWVECDTNLPNGESLVRQFLYGQRYFKSRFGNYCNVAWLPDTFGYSSQYPQLAREAGMKYFFTQKLSWSQFNKFPHTTFNWAGLDGTLVLTHMTPVDTYNAYGSAGDVYKSVHSHKNLQATDLALIPFGNGDGGGGALPEMLERLRRVRSIANNYPELPKVSMGKSVHDFFVQVDNETNHGKTLPTWSGELYLEFHRGTYTSHSDVKKNNRICEGLLRELEYIATYASFLAAGSYKYPKKSLDEMWELVLLCQFHDVLPGSAIAMVYEDAKKFHMHVIDTSTKLIEKALDIIDKTCLALGRTRLFAMNTLVHYRNEIAHIPQPLLSEYKNFLRSRYTSLEETPYGQCIQETRFGEGYVNLVSHANSEIATARQIPDIGQAHVEQVDSETFVLRNGRVEVKINTKGQMTSLITTTEEGTERQLIAPGEFAGFTQYDDRPNSFDAWDVDAFHLQTEKHIEADNVEIIDKGPLRATLAINYKLGHSNILAHIALDAVGTCIGGPDTHMIRISTNIDWHERHVFLKFSLPTTIKSDFATYETQFGNITRPTHRNTSWDAAKFEVCGHRFADLSEYGYGIGLVNNSKYGYAVCGSVMRLSLLRSSTAPDSNQDQGKHEFAFAIVPHKGTFTESNVIEVARAFNSPLRTKQGCSASSATSSDKGMPLISLNGTPNVTFEGLKRGEDDDEFNDGKTNTKTAVVRIYESRGGRGDAKLIMRMPVTKVQAVDILEREKEDLTPNVTFMENGDVVCPITLRPYQIFSLKIWV